MRCVRGLSVRRVAYADLGTLRISAEEEAWLREACPYFQEKYLAFLRDFQLRPADEVDVRFVPTDGEYGQLEVLIQGAWASVILYEVPVMAIISETYFQTVDRDWTAAGQRERAADKARKLLQHGVMLSEFGTRRRRSLATHVEVMHGLLDAQKEVGDAPGAGRILGTSNIYLAKQFGVAPVGTVAHEWTMAIAAIHGYEHSNLRALQLWDAVYQPPAFTPARPVDDLTIALTDTFSTRVFWDDLLSSESGKEILRRWRGVRQDSGDSRVFVRHALDVYRSIGVDPAKKLVIFSDGTSMSLCRPQCRAVSRAPGVCEGNGHPRGFRRGDAPDERLWVRFGYVAQKPRAEYGAQARLDQRAPYGQDQRRAYEEHGRCGRDCVRCAAYPALSSAALVCRAPIPWRMRRSRGVGDPCAVWGPAHCREVPRMGSVMPGS